MQFKIYFNRHLNSLDKKIKIYPAQYKDISQHTNQNQNQNHSKKKKKLSKKENLYTTYSLVDLKNFIKLKFAKLRKRYFSIYIYNFFLDKLIYQIL